MYTRGLYLKPEPLPYQPDEPLGIHQQCQAQHEGAFDNFPGDKCVSPGAVKVFSPNGVFKLEPVPQAVSSFGLHELVEGDRWTGCSAAFHAVLHIHVVMLAEDKLAGKDRMAVNPVLAQEFLQADDIPPFFQNEVP